MVRHLIHVGYPKSGSTFLQAWFERHPAFHYATGGVAGFRSVFEMCHALPPGYHYHVTSCEGLSGPNDAAGDLRMARAGRASRPAERFRERQAEVCGLLRGLYPDSRILVVTRGFRGMILSGYSEFIRTGGTLHPEAMCRSMAEQLGPDERHFYDFDYLIGLYADAFGADNVIVLPYELLRDDQARFLAVLEERLGVPHAEVELGRVHASLSPEELYWYPLISRAVFAAGAPLPVRFRERVYRAYANRTYGGRLGPAVRLLRRLRPGKKVTWEDFPPDVLQGCRGRAERLRGDPLYAPYAAEYLWEEESSWPST